MRDWYQAVPMDWGLGTQYLPCRTALPGCKSLAVGSIARLVLLGPLPSVVSSQAAALSMSA